MSGPVAIGIDLGTTYFRVGIYRNKHFDVICNEEGKRQTPCFVALVGDRWIVGDAAKRRAHDNVANTFYSFKRLIGRTFDDLSELMGNDRRLYEILDKDGKAMIRVGGGEIFPIELSARILCKAREIAEKHLHREVRMAVITVPAHFTNDQKLATLQAGELAGLQVLDLITDPVAAAISYASEELNPRNVLLVVSVGGGWYDVSVVSLKNGKVERCDSFGSMDVGGQDVDAALFAYFITKNAVSDLGMDKTQLFVFLQECEKAKRNLAQCKSTVFSAKALDSAVELTMSTADIMTVETSTRLVTKISESVKSALREYNKCDIEAVLVGGCTRMTCIQEVLLHAQVEINHVMNEDEAIIEGAACHAYVLCAGEELLAAKQSLDYIYGNCSTALSKDDISKIHEKLQKERESLIQNKEREKKMNELERLIYHTRKELINAGCKGKVLQCCTEGIQWIADFQSSANNDQIRKKSEEISALLTVRALALLCVIVYRSIKQ